MSDPVEQYLRRMFAEDAGRAPTPVGLAGAARRRAGHRRRRRLAVATSSAVGVLAVATGVATAGMFTQVTRVPQPSVSREVATLVDLGLVTTELVHGRRTLRANPESPIFPELSSLVLKTAGPAIVIARHLQGAAGVVEAHLYGSWARRQAGEAGPAPGDIDVLVVGTVDVPDVRHRTDSAAAELGRDVNVTVLGPEDWDHPSSSFVRHVRTSPLVPLDLSVTPVDGRRRR